MSRASLQAAFRTALCVVLFTAGAFITLDSLPGASTPGSRSQNIAALLLWGANISIMVAAPVLGAVTLTATGFLLGAILGGLLAFLTTIHIMPGLSITICFVVTLASVLAASVWGLPSLAKIVVLAFVASNIYVLQSPRRDQFVVLAPVCGIVAGC